MKIARRALAGTAAILLLPVAACTVASLPGRPASAQPAETRAEQLLLLNRVSWGVNASELREIAQLGTQGWLERQLDPNVSEMLPADVQAQIDAMEVSRKKVPELIAQFQEMRKDAKDDPEKRKALQQAMTGLAREAASRSLLRAVYSPRQLESQMTWFWMNHFSVFQGKGPVRALVGDYEEQAIRPNALGRFRDLLGATARHPAMLVYLDNARNAASHINENYARELMELHTLGVDGGYTQKDVQELARILTGFSIDREGYRFYPRRHDAGDKQFLGTVIRGGGERELDQALDLLARHPATARFVSRKLAVYFVSDEPPAALVDRLAATFRATDGDISRVLKALFASPEFSASLGTKFKDPMHYVVSALRLAYDRNSDADVRAVPNTNPPLFWLLRMGEPLYGRQTPDGYPLARSDWASAGQLATRFEVARAIGFNAPGRLAYAGALGPATLAALGKASTPQEWNELFLSSPEFMNR